MVSYFFANCITLTILFVYSSSPLREDDVAKELEELQLAEGGGSGVNTATKDQEPEKQDKPVEETTTKEPAGAKGATGGKKGKKKKKNEDR